MSLFRYLMVTLFGVSLLSLTCPLPSASTAQGWLHLPKPLRDLVTNSKTQGKFHRGDLIPDLPNVLRLPNETSFSVDSENAKGTVTLAHLVATGLDTLLDDMTVNLATMRISATLSVPVKIWVSGDYSLDGKVNPNEDDTTSVSGSGTFTGTVTNLNVAMDAKLDVALLSGRVTISNMDLQMAYDSISVKADNFALNEETVDWESVNGELNENFESVWDQYREPLVTAITEGVNELMSEATVSDLVDVFQGKKNFEQLINPSPSLNKKV